MSTNKIDQNLFVKMLQLGLQNLSNQQEYINKLNVFPVPDGDTGTNMNLTMTSGLKEVEKIKEEPLGKVVQAFVKGLLMGARGNSGVILSQLFRGFATDIDQINELTSKNFAQALENGVGTAYQSVTNPVEGTILTVAKDSANVAKVVAEDVEDIEHLLEKVIEEAKASLLRTPDLLPILKEVGVVDSGGQGLLAVYEGFLTAIKGGELPKVQEAIDMEDLINLEHERAVQSYVDIESIEYGYCTEFIIEFDEEKIEVNSFEEEQFRKTLGEYGDSLLVASDENIVKIHIHTEEPGKVMTIAQQYGDLVEIDIENMRQQYKDIVDEEKTEQKVESPLVENAVISVAVGSGIKEMLYSIGAAHIIEGGQTMNPSTEDILAAINETNANNIFILPNNKNIIMAANQAATLIEDKKITVIPSKTLSQGIKAMLDFDEDASVEENEQLMLESIGEVKSGVVTYAIRDTKVNGLEIKEGNFIGLDDDTIKATGENKLKVAVQLLMELIEEDDEIVTTFYGEDVSEEEVEEFLSMCEAINYEVEFEMVKGEQPIYSFIFMVE